MMSMSVCFYPKHEFACPSLSHCPHLGGMALGTLVVIASRRWGSMETQHFFAEVAENQQNHIKMCCVPMNADAVLAGA